MPLINFPLPPPASIPKEQHSLSEHDGEVLVRRRLRGLAFTQAVRHFAGQASEGGASGRSEEVQGRDRPLREEGASGRSGGTGEGQASNKCRRERHLRGKHTDDRSGGA